MTAARPAIAEPEVKRRLRRRPPNRIRNGRALMLGIAGYAFAALFLLLLGGLINARGPAGAVLPAAAVTIPVGVISIAVVRLTRTRQVWALALVVGWGLVIAVAVGYLIVTMSSRFNPPDANATFFSQLLLTPAFVLAVASIWHFVRGARWFNGEWEKPLKADESGARPIAAPLVAAPRPGPPPRAPRPPPAAATGGGPPGVPSAGPTPRPPRPAARTGPSSVPS